MYSPPHYQEGNPEEARRIIRENPFGILFSQSQDGPVATHIPFMLEEAEDGLGTLIGHMARANPQWNSWTEQTELLIVFPGPHAYISPGWYANPKNVPTWNYLSVHAYGSPRLTEDPDRLNEMVEKLTGEYEKGDRWDTEQGKHNRERMLRAIVGFEIPISRWEAKRKLNQNKTAEDRRGVIQALEDSGYSVSQQVADEMKRLK